MDTIFAQATAPGRSGVAVIRISGPRAFEAAETLAGAGLPQDGRALRVLRTRDGERLDQALVLTFRGPASFTGEDVAELHVHGSIAGVAAILRELGTLSELRGAEAGEFTLRALQNGKLDLSQVEGLADLIDAETDEQRRQAFRVFSGELSERADAWRVQLIRAVALVEASLDFADEEVPEDVGPEVSGILARVRGEISEVAEGVGIAERVRDGFVVAIVGAPNVGKSTLLNALAGRDAAITSERAGTTRDVIEVRMDLAGLPVTLLDTAGLRETEDEIERMGVDLAVRRARSADMRVFLGDVGSGVSVELRPGDIRVRPKADLLDDVSGAVSGKTGEGVGALVDRIGAELSSRLTRSGVATRARHKSALDRAAGSLRAAEKSVEDGEVGYDLAAEHLRDSLRALEILLGRMDVEAVLGEIFSSFCIGK